MGKHGKRGGGRGGGPGKPYVGKDPRNTNPWNDFTMESMKNAVFEEYYRAQNIVPDDEWDSFLKTLKVELPTTFRVTGSRAHAETINDRIKDQYVPTMQDIEVEGVKYDPPKPLAWYPDGLAWELSAPKRIVRKQEAFKTFQRFLVGETDVGNLSRQEAVSMIPPLLMDVEPQHSCLDMCAAPGSKIIEALNPHHTEATGMLIANDADYKRTHMLVHQTGRMPSKALIVTNFDATMFPNISLGSGKTLKFDRILADVPCSGDGTMRKNIEIWKKWMPSDGNNLHQIQLRILERAMNMLKPGGRLVYSTCSFNPTENEAVVAAALNSHAGQFTIVDVEDKLPNLRRRPGIAAWKVATRPNKELVFHESFESYRKRVDAGEENEKDKEKGVPASAWAPPNAGELHLERCLRLLPHDQNTGGFFVAVLEKAADAKADAEADADVEEKAKAAAQLEAEAKPEESKEAETIKPEEVTEADAKAEEAAKAEEDAQVEKPEAEAKAEETKPEAAASVEPIKTDEATSTAVKRPASPSAESGPEEKKARAEGAPLTKKEKRDLQFREDPFSFVDPNHAEVQTVVNWFQLEDSFPRHNLLVRNDYGNPLRTVYIVNDAVKAIIQNNDYTRLRMISAGVKAFIRQDSQARADIKCKWRVSSDGILEILKHVPPATVHEAGMDELRIFLEEMYPPIDKFSGKFKEILQAAELGNMLVVFAAGEGAGGKLPLPMYLPVWKAKQSMSLLIDKREKSVLSQRTFGADICKPAPPPKSVEDSGASTPIVVTSVSGTATPALEDEESAMNTGAE